VVGVVHRMLAVRLRRGEQALGELGDQLTEWLSSYRTEIAKHNWRALKPHRAQDPSPYPMPPAMRAPAPVGPGRQRLSKRCSLQVRVASELALYPRNHSARVYQHGGVTRLRPALTCKNAGCVCAGRAVGATIPSSGAV
jgi:hypothetical protein